MFQSFLQHHAPNPRHFAPYQVKTTRLIAKNRSSLPLMLSSALTCMAINAAIAQADVKVIHDEIFSLVNWEIKSGGGTNFDTSQTTAFQSVGSGVTGNSQQTYAFRAAGFASFTYEVDHY